MAHADMNRLMDALRVRLPGALDDGIKMELYSALDEFFQESSVWKEKIPFQVQPGVTLYSIASAQYTASIIRLEGVKTSDDIHQRALMATPEKVDLAHAPALPDTFTASVVLTVSDPVTSEGYPRVPRWVTDKYREGILDGVLGRMFSQPMKPWTSERHAIYHLRRFRNAISRARTDAIHYHVQNGQAWRFPSFR